MADDDYIAFLPKAWRSALSPFAIERIDHGMGEASVFRLRKPDGIELYLKIADGTAVPELVNEVKRTKWLEQRGVRVPSVTRVHNDNSLAAFVMTAVSGRHPQEVSESIPRILRNLASGLRSLHSVPVVDCPFDESISARLRRAREMIMAGLVSPEYFEERNRGQSPESIYDRLRRRVPEHEDTVLVHGDATFDNLLIDDKGNIGFVDCGHAGRGDRYLDLSTIMMDIDEHFGPDAKQLFLSSYGMSSVEANKLEFFSDLYELF